MNPQANIVGDNICKARKNKQLSQAQLAEQVFVSAQAVGKWERGESLPDLITVARLAELLDVDLNYFIRTTKTQSEHYSLQLDSDEASTSTDRAASVLSPDSFTSPSRTSEYTDTGSEERPIWNLSEGNWNTVDFSAVDNIGSSLNSSNLLNSNFSAANFSDLSLERVNAYGCTFNTASFLKSGIAKSNFSKDLFQGCAMRSLDCKESYFTECDFSSADWSYARFKRGGMDKCTVNTVTLNCTVFEHMYLADLVFSGDITNCVFENCKFSNVTFQDVVFSNTFFKCRSLKKIRFIDCYADRLTYEALCNGGVSRDGLSLRG